MTVRSSRYVFGTWNTVCALKKNPEAAATIFKPPVNEWNIPVCQLLEMINKARIVGECMSHSWLYEICDETT